MTKAIDGELFEKIVLGGANNLKRNVQVVNDLNVFPIPDGDTGDNMYMTLAGGLSGLKAVQENSVSKKSQALASGMLFNARGNSGVILSQLFYGLAEGLKGEDTASIEEFSAALKVGVKKAYASVVKPVEGTMLTVAREACEFTCEHMECCGRNCTLEEFFTDFVLEMQKSLDRTPELLSVLKDAGVIDSGGAGLLYIVEGMKSALNGVIVDDEVAVTADNKTVDFSRFDEDSELTFGYCTECLLRLQNRKVDIKAFDPKQIIDFLQTIGDSIVCIKTDSIVKIHVHTFTPSKVLEFCQQFGEFLTVKIENMTLQHNENEEGSEQSKTAAHSFEGAKPKIKKHKKYGVVTIATGKGLIDTFTECGADVVIDGGQGNNPSIETFIEAFNEVDAEHIFVLPNNSNIIMAARQAGDMYDKAQIHVVETKNFGQAYSILTMLDFSSDDVDLILQNMQNDISNVVTGMITPSVRSATLDGVDIVKGDYIGFTDKVMQVAKKSKTQAFKALADKLLTDDTNFMIAVYGKDVDAKDRAVCAEYISENYPAIEYYEIDGGQDVYEFILIIE